MNWFGFMRILANDTSTASKECGGITRVQIEKDKIYYSEPTYWELTKGATHSGCYECSDIPPAGRVGLE